MRITVNCSELKQSLPLYKFVPKSAHESNGTVSVYIHVYVSSNKKFLTYSLLRCLKNVTQINYINLTASEANVNRSEKMLYLVI